ncbi:MAG: MBL fold metallo-hydrolase [Alcanivorax sp.]|nr:MBL fold metallo-hydrolase [Alcanivorax sp.]
MKIASLGSGSKGNATLVQSGDTLVMVDCGFSLRETLARLARLGTDPAQIGAVLVTHEHGDHVNGVLPLARRLGIPVYLSHGTGRVLAERDRFDTRGVVLHEVRPGRTLSIGALTVTPVPVPHDAREPCQYVFDDQRRKAGVLTDLGMITSHVVDAYQACDALVLECNHDRDMLAMGHYPMSLKRRVGGQWGHLNNRQAGELVAEMDQPRLQHLVLSHLSADNNTPEHALAAMAEAGFDDRQRLRVASQGDGFPWLTVE